MVILCLSIAAIGPESSCAHVIEKTAEHSVQPGIPLSPIVAAWDHVKFVSEVPLLENLGETAIRREQPFLVAAREKKVGHPRRIY
jgi:hypothetical protein